ncbi:exodeoxyribonuclease VII large subunit [Xylanibacter muris]|uniref:Exodeoxyribonuclease 7 large subunit n=1 Tax=Xylanibacter muris TaxID=2736290 RepID=A0ABX2AKY2_9BACT|nr:exodeoxyribonuclease VII large subunit [Xylanibacter muris]NPD91543.1 exodeoxyribonuclease VII large subunit [Xylanibacter muris]
MIKEKTFSLFELNSIVRHAIETSMDGEYWVEAEISELREVRGHCYMELTDKDPSTNTPTAKAQAKCWSRTWNMLLPYFMRITGQPLRPGQKVMLKVYPQFHEAYGFSWIITDINPDFTLGDMARKRMEIIRILKEEGVFDLNKELRLPLFTQRIAVISSENAAGYGDFRNQLENNEYGFCFTLRLFSAIMQGEGVEKSLIGALDDIYGHIGDFDCVVIIRGGGATSDMSGFDTLALAENVANFPLPIITGIGHDRDESILDMVSHTRVKTPTAAAALLIDRLKNVDDRITAYSERLTRYATAMTDTEQHRLEGFKERIPALYSVIKTRNESRTELLYTRILSATGMIINTERHRLDTLANSLVPAAGQITANRMHSLNILSQRLELLNPQRMLERGYSITTLNGMPVRDPAILKQGNVIETRLEKGTIKSEII